MNWVIFTTCFAATLTVACATVCRKAEDCPKSHCCVALSVLQLQRKGLCLKLARKGKACSEPESQLDYYNGKYVRSCPCEEGFSCQPKKLKPGNTDQGAFLASLRCEAAVMTPEPETTPVEEITEVNPEEETGNEGDDQEEVIDEGTDDEGTEDEVVDEGTDDEGTDEIVDEGTDDEGTEDEVVDEGTDGEGTGDEVVDEGTDDEGTGDEVVDEGTDDEGTGDEVVDEGTDDEGTEDEVVDEETDDEGTEDEVVDEGNDVEETEDEVVDEETEDEEGNEENNEILNDATDAVDSNEVIPAEIAEGPGGEKPRDDDCIDWEYPC